MQLQNNIKFDDLEYIAKRQKLYNFSKYFLFIVFLRKIHERSLQLEDTDKKQSQLVNELQNMGKGEISFEKKMFFKQYRITS